MWLTCGTGYDSRFLACTHHLWRELRSILHFCATAFRSHDASQALCSVIDIALQMLAYQLVGVDALQVL